MKRLLLTAALVGLLVAPAVAGGGDEVYAAREAAWFWPQGLNN